MSGAPNRVGIIPTCKRCYGTLRIPVKSFATGKPAGDGPCPDCTHRLSLCGVVVGSPWHEQVACAYFPGHEGPHSWASIPALDPREAGAVDE
jgi:hypothetical protein